MIAILNSAHSGLFSESKTTRSPGAIPCLTRLLLITLTIRSDSRHDSVSQPSDLRLAKQVRSVNRDALAKKPSGSVLMLSILILEESGIQSRRCRNLTSHRHELL